MEPKVTEHTEPAADPLRLSEGLVRREAPWPTVFIDTRGRDLRSSDPTVPARVKAAIVSALEYVHDGPTPGQTLLKVHIGERKCDTRLRPEFMAGSAAFLNRRGASTVVAGDTTVAYSGPRGHKRNPAGDVAAYMTLARENGWWVGGPARLPFVVLDRPCCAPARRLDFEHEEQVLHTQGVRRFRDFFAAG